MITRLLLHTYVYFNLEIFFFIIISTSGSNVLEPPVYDGYVFIPYVNIH